LTIFFLICQSLLIQLRHLSLLKLFERQGFGHSVLF
jgi:hypothetical protein